LPAVVCSFGETIAILEIVSSLFFSAAFSAFAACLDDRVTSIADEFRADVDEATAAGWARHDGGRQQPSQP
jgi:hypothetical protein